MEVNDRYDFLIVGAGLYGASLARELTDRGCRVLVVEKRNHIAGNAYTEMQDGICVHMYGPHIFHTDSEEVWAFVNRFARFNNYVHQPAADFRGERYSLPFNMNTFREMWGVTGPEEAEAIIRKETNANPTNLEEQAISLVGTDIYEKLIRGYTEKQWGRPCSELPASIIKRIPVRYEYNNNYFDDRYQGIPVGGYTEMTARMLDGIKVMTGTDYLEPETRRDLESAADCVIFSGQIDEYYGYCYGPLEYRGLRFENETLRGVFQDRAVVNYTDRETPWIRITEHRHFAGDAGRGKTDAGAAYDGMTIITREYPAAWKPGDIPFYPVSDDASRDRYLKYRELADADEKVHFGGRLGSYQYYDMDDVILEALQDADKLIKNYIKHR